MLRGNVHRLARKEFDLGAVPDSLPMERVTMTFKPTGAQEAALNQLLAEQQDPASPNYHFWLTPEEFADRFGVSAADIQKVVDWLRDRGFTISEIARSRQWVSFTGAARDIAGTFETEIHTYEINNELHYANAGEPSVPASLRSVVAGFRNLNDFRLKSHAKSRNVKPDFTSSITGNHFLTPDDLATIYDIKSLYNAGIDGSGQKIAIVGQTDILTSDIQAFRSASALPANMPQVILVPGSRDPGMDLNDMSEADLDIQWAGAVARNATIIYVNSNNGVFDSLQYAVDQNLAPVVAVTYGDCEANWTSADTSSLIQLAKQANAEGMTISAAAGDDGAADCDSTNATVAVHGLGVDLPGAMPYVTSIGGTTLDDSGSVFSAADQIFGTLYRRPQPSYWSATNNGANGSALSYIPEIAWNDTSFAGQLAAGGGGRSIQFSKPAWQSVSGVPNDNKRDVPDVSLAASAIVNAYLSCSNNSCVNGYRAADNSLNAVGGTSVGAPVFAGIVALINQKANSAQGNLNPVLYALAASTPSAFHDVTSSGNDVPCRAGTLNCPSGGYLGYAAGRGYDLATGLGSVDVFKLISVWP